jgi:hypothetical protein
VRAELNGLPAGDHTRRAEIQKNVSTVLDVFGWITAEQQEECEYNFVSMLVCPDYVFMTRVQFAPRGQYSFGLHRSSTAKSRRGATAGCGMIQSKHNCAGAGLCVVLDMTRKRVRRRVVNKIGGFRNNYTLHTSHIQLRAERRDGHICVLL